MKYQITIVRMEKNPKFEEEMEQWKAENNRPFYNGDIIRYAHPIEEVPKNTLMVELTEEEYKKVKEAVITVFN